MERVRNQTIIKRPEKPILGEMKNLKENIKSKLINKFKKKLDRKKQNGRHKIKRMPNSERSKKKKWLIKDHQRQKLKECLNSKMKTTMG